MRVTGSLEGEQRRQALVDLLARHGSLKLADTAAAFGVHEMTVRRDLEQLEREGAARRVRGGAVAPRGDDFTLRLQRAKTAKQQIVRKLLPLVPMSGAIGIDASTTLVNLAGQVRGPQLTAITNGWATFEALRRRPGVRALLTGGESEEHNASLVGPLAIQSLFGFHFDRAFLSTTSLDADSGTSEPTLPQVDVKRAMIAVADHVVVAADSSKLGTRSPVRALELAQIDLLVTELDPHDCRLDPYRDQVALL